MEAHAAALAALLAQLRGTSGPAPAVVGYSMGARIALFLALRHRGVVASVAIVSGTAGVRGPAARSARALRDDGLASALEAQGAHAFAKGWYQQKLFASLSRHPRCSELA